MKDATMALQTSGDGEGRGQGGKGGILYPPLTPWYSTAAAAPAGLDLAVDRVDEPQEDAAVNGLDSRLRRSRGLQQRQGQEVQARAARGQGPSARRTCAGENTVVYRSRPATTSLVVSAATSAASDTPSIAHAEATAAAEAGAKVLLPESSALAPPLAPPLGAAAGLGASPPDADTKSTLLQWRQREGGRVKDAKIQCAPHARPSPEVQEARERPEDPILLVGADVHRGHGGPQCAVVLRVGLLAQREAVRLHSKQGAGRGAGVPKPCTQGAAARGRT